MADDVQITVGADVDDAVAGLGQLQQAVAAATQPVAQLQSAFVGVGAAAGRIAQPFSRAFDEIGRGWQSAVAGLIAGTLTWQRAAQRVSLSVTRGLVGLAGSALSQAAAGPLAGLLGQAAPRAGQGVGDVLGSALGGWLTGAPQQLGTAATTTANTAALAANTAALATLTASLGAATATSGAGTLGSAAQLAGGTAELGSAAAGGGGILGFLGGLFAFAGGGIVPSAAGGWALPNFPGARPALLHAREMVLPAPISEGLQRMIAAGGDAGGGAGGDLHLHFHGPADGPAVERWFRGFLAKSPDVIRDMLRSNALTPRSL